MMKVATALAIAAVGFFAFGRSLPGQAQQTTMSFFITSVGLGKGGDLGGLAGADRHCQSLAAAAGEASAPASIHQTPAGRRLLPRLPLSRSADASGLPFFVRVAANCLLQRGSAVIAEATARRLCFG